MRVTPPGSLKIDRAELLRDVRERLEARAPALAAAFDPAHPAWLVLEEAAWIVERWSEALDAWPWAVVQQFAHLLGAEVQPALPAVGVVVLEPAEPGRLALAGNPARWRLFASQNEERGLVEFALAEQDVPLWPGSLGGLARLRDGELFVSTAEPDRALPGLVTWFGEERRAEAFAREQFRYHLRVSDPDRVETELREVVARLFEARDPGWLVLDVQRREDNQVVLVATIDVSLARARADDGAPEDVVADWRALDDSAWTPPVRVRHHDVLPPKLRGARPLRADDGRLLVPGVPSTMLRNELLERDARPAPAEIPEALWRTLVHLDRRLAALEPTITRGIVGTADPAWVDDALRGQAWSAVESGPDQSLAALDLDAPGPARDVRVAWVVEPGVTRNPRAFARFPNSGLHPAPLPCTVAWELSLPDPQGRGMVQVIALDVSVPAGASGLLLAIDGPARGVLFNAAMVINAPAVMDGRTARVSRAVPEPISLLFEDVVVPATLERLAGSGLPESATRVLRSLPCALTVVDGEQAILDFVGVQVDPVQGVITLNAPDDAGRAYPFRRGQSVELRWYRRTQAAQGNVRAGEINFAEQAPATRPRIARVTNPLATAWGQPREREEEAITRVFGPQGGVPVTPGDWERAIRVELGARGEGWTVRVWSYAERSLLSHALWPPHQLRENDAERDRLENALATAGPDVLLVVLGPEQGVLSDLDLDHARRTIDALVARHATRLPTIRRAEVTRFWPLRLEGWHDGVTPSFSPLHAEGTLVDNHGRRAPVPDVSLLLNAAIVEVVG